MATTRKTKGRITVRVDEDLKQDAADLYAALGLDLSTAINIFLRKSVNEQALPFELSYKVSPHVAQAIKEAENGETTSYDSVEDFLRDLHQYANED